MMISSDEYDSYIERMSTTASKNTFQIINDEIQIFREGWPCSGIATYREDYYDEMASYTWNMNKKRYVTNAKLGGYLHRYMISKWYGQTLLDELTEKGYVIDHINNKHNDCRICNLEFLKRNYNTAKGNELDLDADRLRKHIALAIYKDFENDYYQIIIGCNDNIEYIGTDKQYHLVDKYAFLYKGGNIERYRIVLHDADNILTLYEQTGEVAVQKTSANWVRIYRAPEIELTEEEKTQAFVNRSGVDFLVLGNGKSYLVQPAPERDWILPDDYDGGMKITEVELHFKNDVRTTL